MNLQKEKSFVEQRNAAQEARERMLARFKSRPKADDPAMIAARAEREALAKARETRIAERETARREAEEKLRQEQLVREEAARQEQAAREAAEAAAKAEAEAVRRAEEARIAAERLKNGGLFDAVQYAQMRASRGRR